MAAARYVPAALAAALLILAHGAAAQEPPYNAEVLDLQATILDLKGFPSDTDAGVSDLSAQISDLAGRHEGLSVRQDKDAVTVSMLGDVLFDFDKAAIRPTAEPALQDIARAIQAAPAGRVAIEGHTDSKGTASYNQTLSVKRANAVLQWLANHGVDKARLAAKGYGDTRPVQPNALANGADNPKGRAQNRRVEFVLPKH
ncbi:OmpA family protein [Achromobacter marplatensis]|uniref:OmpA family protein n=1 Tax=Achromobacter marplatensis TaxID=470868 RepID=A0AA43B0F0_9BURK|nr:OmpA family protein [Achromobacter marplatensis]MDH2049654.1 OmpA family protein [Achromobacter marplatensis]